MKRADLMCLVYFHTLKSIGCFWYRNKFFSARFYVI